MLNPQSHQRWLGLLSRLKVFAAGNETGLYHTATFELAEANQAFHNEPQRQAHLDKAEKAIQKLESDPLDQAMIRLKRRTPFVYGRGTKKTK